MCFKAFKGECLCLENHKNIALLDLQNFTAEALREIKKIESCAMLLIPKNASDEWKNAYAKITIRNVASIIEVSYGKYSVLNGMVVLNDKMFPMIASILSTALLSLKPLKRFRIYA